MARILVWLNTYNRAKMLLGLINSIEKQKKDHDVKLFIFDDHSREDYEEIKEHKLVHLFYSNNEHYGKENYWKLINLGLKQIEQYQKEYDLFIKTDDDVLVCENFFDICLDYWKALYTPKLFSIDILSAPRQRGKTIQGEKTPVIKRGEYSFYQTQWVDMNFIFNIRAFNKIRFEIKNCHSSLRTSGVGLWLTSQFNKFSFEMYQSPVSLLIHKEHSSKMHSVLRSQTPIVTQELK